MSSWRSAVQSVNRRSMQLPDHYLQQQVELALAEDIGSGDVTAALVPANQAARAHILCRESAILCGTAWVNEVFHQVDPAIHVVWQLEDGAALQPGQVICTLTGPARSLLSGERTALNFLQTLSGTATRTRQFVDAIAGTGCHILDTRKTLPGLRLAQKYAVHCGGGKNHRLGLYDMVLIKENHIAAAGSIRQAVVAARNCAPGLTVEVEVENLSQLQEALAANVDRILLDNQDLATLKQAVQQTAGQIPLEASGGITLDTVRQVAETGVDYISIGAITKHVHAVDLSMRFI
jgi:nicotinate-nucleotide pyrophosphorylase (carboxylating)